MAILFVADQDELVRVLVRRTVTLRNPSTGEQLEQEARMVDWDALGHLPNWQVDLDGVVEVALAGSEDVLQPIEVVDEETGLLKVCDALCERIRTLGHEDLEGYDLAPHLTGKRSLYAVEE